METISVGRVVVPIDKAKQWVREYTDPKRKAGKKPYAYPAYDAYASGSASTELNDGDILAPALLNSTPSVSAVYRFQEMQENLQAVLRAHPDRPLVAMADDVVTAKVRDLYQVLDDDRSRHGKRGQGGTTLSKILHRKRDCCTDR